MASGLFFGTVPVMTFTLFSTPKVNVKWYSMGQHQVSNTPIVYGFNAVHDRAIFKGNQILVFRYGFAGNHPPLTVNYSIASP